MNELCNSSQKYNKINYNINKPSSTVLCYFQMALSWYFQQICFGEYGNNTNSSEDECFFNEYVLGLANQGCSGQQPLNVVAAVTSAM